MTKQNHRQKQPPYNKANPGANGNAFIPIPVEALHYVNHPRIEAEHLILFAIYIHYYNVEKGAAWPSRERLAREYGKSPRTITTHVSDLVAVGLLDKIGKGHYIPLTPLKEDAFYIRFPEADENRRKRYAASDARHKTDIARLKAYKESAERATDAP